MVPPSSMHVEFVAAETGHLEVGRPSVAGSEPSVTTSVIHDFPSRVYSAGWCDLILIRGGRLDVDVSVKHVLRVVLRLDRGKPGVLRPVGVPDPLSS